MFIRPDQVMDYYDPLQNPDPAKWQAIDESERIDLVVEYHQDSEDELPNEMVHASIHVAVENQLALGERPVQETLDRLMRQGLDRHDAIHAIGAVLGGFIHELLCGEQDTAPDMRCYYRRLKKLTAKRWRKGKW